MINISVPGFFENHILVMKLLEIWKNNPEYFYQDRTIDSLYGTNDSLIWRGGRYVITPYKYNIASYIKDLEYFPEIKLRYTFTNCLITEQIVNDYICNNYVSTLFRPRDEVILNHPLLIEHFKKNYPNIPIIYSTTLGISDVNKINEITKDNLYVINYNFNNNNEYLKQLKHPNNIELICAEPCITNCPFRNQHYKTISKQVLNMPLDNNDIEVCCMIPEPVTIYDIMQRSHAITNERIKELETIGIVNFKISGRGILPPQWVDSVLYYLVLPEYLDHVKEKILCSMYYG